MCTTRLLRAYVSLVFRCTSATFSLTYCPRHLTSDQVRQAIRHDCRRALINSDLPCSSFAVFDHQLLSCLFQTVGTQRSPQLVNSQALASGSCSWCPSGFICTLLDRPRSAVMRCSVTTMSLLTSLTPPGRSVLYNLASVT